MKIGLVVPHLKIAGGIRVILSYANELIVLGHQVTVFSPITGRVHHWFTNWLTFKPKWFNNLDPRIKFKFFASRSLVLGSEELDFIVADSWPMAKLVNELSVAAKKFHLIQHDERLYHGAAEAVAKTYTLPLQKIVVATWLKEMLARDFNQSSQVLLNSFDPEIFKYEPQAKPKDGFTRVLILDHSYEWKGTKEAVGIVNNLKLKYPRLLLMAFGARHSQLVNNYDEYYYQPAQAELANIYNRADIFLCASWDEGFGLPSLEAMACGTAVVTYDNGGSRDFAIEGETALVAPRQDQAALAAKLEQLVSNQELRQKISQKALELTKSWPTWTDQTIKLLSILQNK